MADLDKYQSAAAEVFCGSFLVLAGPGSGKTRTLLERINNLTEHHRVPIEKICLLTFTRDAADEMSMRYAALKEGRRKKASFYTFHSLFFSILKEELFLKNSDILMGKQKIAMMKEAFFSSGIPVKPDPLFFSELSKEISINKNGGEGKEFSVLSKEEFIIYLRTLDSLKRKYGKIDFDDMQYEAGRLLSSDERILKKWRDRFSFFMVDEAQDMNRIQYDILKLLTIESGNVFLVGDDDQSIYSFRGADPTVLMRFKEEYKDCGILYLKKNYRSDISIVKGADTLIKNNKIRFPKEFIAQSTEEGRISYKAYENPREEADDIIRRIKMEIRQGTKNNEIAVLYRNNYEGNRLNYLLKKEGLLNISLHTFHGAKGLEWNTVYIINVNDGITPSKKAKDNASIEEERRMFYVAMTRAKHRLFLCSVKRYDNAVLYPSPYLRELSEERTSS